MYASPTKCTQVRRGVRMQKKKKKKRDQRRPCLAFDFTERSLHRAGATHVRTVVLAKGIISQVCRCFVNVKHFLRKGKAHDCSNRKACESPFSSSPLWLRGFRLVRRQRQDKYNYTAVPRLVQRQTSGRRTRARGWTLSGGRAADCELRLLDHEFAIFVMWISRPCIPVRKCQLREDLS